MIGEDLTRASSHLNPNSPLSDRVQRVLPNARGERLGKSASFFPVRSTAWLGAAWGRRSAVGTTSCLHTLPAWQGAIVRFAAVGDAAVSTARVPPAPRCKRASSGPAWPLHLPESKPMGLSHSPCTPLGAPRRIRGEPPAVATGHDAEAPRGGGATRNHQTRPQTAPMRCPEAGRLHATAHPISATNCSTLRRTWVNTS
jgi:hypothetical protein